GELYYADVGQSGSACEFSGIQHIFSYVVCSFTTIMNGVMGKLYCGIQYAASSVLSIALSIYVLVFGMQILMGTARINSKEIVMRLFKLAAVWAFVTQSAWGIGLAFNFFISFMSQGAMWVTNAVMPQIGATDQNAMPVYVWLDNLIYQA